MKAVLLALLVSGVVLAGCSGSKTETGTDSEVVVPGEIEVSETTGGMRGVVLDSAIRPVKGASIEVGGPEKKVATSDTNGGFVITGLKPGTYLVKASHPLYDSQQQSVDVKAGEKSPKVVKIQLQQVIFTQPYLKTSEFKGFIVCSIGLGFVASEECGEGVGVPCVAPGQPCGRVGGQGNNHVQYDFYPDSERVRSIVVEQVWTPNSEATGEFYTVLATDWTCDPVCGGNELNITTGPSPLYERTEIADGAGKGIDNVTSSTRFSTFTWPNWGETTSHNVALNQEFQLFVTMSYELPLPPGWSFLNHSPDPFK